MADEDGHIAQQETRINELHNRLMMHDGRLVEQSNEHSMLHDYACGLHYGLAESGGFLRFGFGLTTDQFTSLASANLVAHGAMGSEQYLRLVRQRARAEHAETTDMPIFSLVQIPMGKMIVNKVNPRPQIAMKWMMVESSNPPPMTQVDRGCEGATCLCNSAWRLERCGTNAISHSGHAYCSAWWN